MAKSTDIVAYDFNATRYCPDHIIPALPTGKGQLMEGWALAPGVRMSTEDNLDEIAAAFGIDRHDECSFDQSEFPKVVFRDQVDADDRCDICGEPLDEVYVR